MQKLPEAPDKKRGDAGKKRERLGKKKETRYLSAVTGEVTTLKSFLLLEEGSTCPSLGGTLVNFSTSRSCLFCQRPTTKNTK